MPKFTSIESFAFVHSMRSNKAPKGVGLAEICPILQKQSNFDLQHLGLFSDSSPNFNTYFPDVKPEDLVPQDSDFAYPVFRALSMTRVNKWGPINFSKEGVLRKSTKKLIGQAVYTNHEMIVGNEVGVISESFFEDEYKSEKGVIIPGGANVRLKLDGKANPKLVRGIMMEPPSIHSVSVTVEFAWEQSHPSMSREDFYNKLGTFDEKGNLIERVVIDIANYHEISLVSHGADPYAQKVNEDGEINDPEYAKRASKYAFNQEFFQKNAHYFDWRQAEDYEKVFSFNAEPKNTILNTLNNRNTQTQNDETMNEQLLIFLREQLGLSKDAKQEDVLAKLQEQLPLVLAASRSLDTTKQTLADLQTKYPEGSEILTADQKTKLASFDSLKAFHDTQLSAIKDEATKLYNLSVGEGKADASVLKLIAEATPETATALLKQYQVIAEKSFEASCASCGSKNITRASSMNASGVQNHDGGNTGGNNNTPVAKSNADVVASFLNGNTKAKTAGIHGDVKP